MRGVVVRGRGVRGVVMRGEGRERCGEREIGMRGVVVRGGRGVRGVVVRRRGE